VVVGIFYIPTKMGEQKYLDIQSHHQLSPESFGEWFFKALLRHILVQMPLPGGLFFWIHRQKQTHDPKDPRQDDIPTDWASLFVTLF